MDDYYTFNANGKGILLVPNKSMQQLKEGVVLLGFNWDDELSRSNHVNSTVFP